MAVLTRRANRCAAIHPEAADWVRRVGANGGGVNPGTVAAVSRLCFDLQNAGLRERIARLNLFVGNNLSAALTPLFVSTSRSGTTIGNATDTNVNFVAGDWNETGASSGFLGNGSTKYLNLGVPGNTFTGANFHQGYGLRATQSGAAAYKHLGGVFDGATRAYDTSVRRNDTNLNNYFGTVGATFNAGEQVQASSLAVGNLTTTYPSLYRNGAVAGTNATASSDYPSSTAWFVFALNNAGTPINHTDARLNWYSLGLGMTAAQVLAYHNVLTTFNATLNRT